MLCQVALDFLIIHYSPFTIYRFFVGKLLVARAPENLTREFHKVDRHGRILVDTGRNDYSATFAAAYTVRARPGAPVSAPCTWEEVECGEVAPRGFTIRNLAKRVETSVISGRIC